MLADQENLHRYSGFKTEAKDYQIWNNATNQYEQYRIRHNRNSVRGYSLRVGGVDSVDVTPTIQIVSY